jgi:uncharacterized iron-regulated membrane protein
MSGILMLLSSLALLGAALVWRFRRRAARPAPTRPVSTPAIVAEDALPGGDDGDGGNGLAAFYAYQMAASRIERT